MIAKVKIAYYDNLGLHKVGEVVEVNKLSYLVEPIETEGETEKPIKKAKTEAKVEQTEEKKVVKKVTKRKK